MQARVAELMPYYTPIGEIFADLHDRPERMLAKGVIRSIVSWRDARTFFYWRLKRRVREEELVASLTAAVGTMSHADALAKLHSSMPADALADDKKAYEMLQKMVIEVQK